MNIRAETKIVGRGKLKPRWPLERAALVNRHNINRKVTEEAHRREIAFVRVSARQAALDEIKEWLKRESNAVMYVMQEAAHEMGRSLGKEIDEWARQNIDPALDEKKRIRNMALSAVNVSTELRENPQNELVSIMRVDWPNRPLMRASVVRGARW